MEQASTDQKTYPAQREQVASGKNRLLLTLVKCLVSGGLIFWIIRHTNLNEILASVRSADALLLTLAFALNFVGWTVSAYRWRMLMRVDGVDARIPFLLSSYIVSMFFNNILPSTIGGDAIRAYDAWRLGQSRAGALAVVFVDRFLGLLTLVLFALGALLVPNRLTSHLPFLPLWVLFGVTGMLVITWLIFKPSQRIATALSHVRLPFIRKLQRIVDAFLIFQDRNDILAKALVLSFILQANVVVHYYLIAQALQFPVPFWSFLLIIPIATFIMLIPVSVNGVGLREGIFVFLFAVYGVSLPDAVAFSWIVLGMVIVQGLLGGVLYALRR